jgi:transaldolase / glucose-6-phosphate isomerase
MSLDVSAAATGIEPVVARWRDRDLMRRLWMKDPTVWFDPPRQETANRLGWLDLPTESETLVDDIGELAAQARSEGVTDVVLCGMGGSSLAPEVFAATLDPSDGAPILTVLDTTHPDAVVRVTGATSPSRTWYVVASKSGSTLETLSLFRHFWEIARAELDRPGSHFIAVTDPGSSLESLARDRAFRATVLANPDVGGRYSALSAFGLVPSGICGADVARLLASGRAGAVRCGPDVDLEENPGFVVGALLATAARRGEALARFAAVSPVPRLPVWIEQLIAESTGKEGVGIVPIDGGPTPRHPGDATTVSIGSSPDQRADIRIRLDDPYEVAGAMFVLELATAVAGEVLGINPFDQPDVQLAKSLAHRAMEGTLDETGVAPVGLDDPGLGERLRSALHAQPRYVSIQAYVDPTTSATEALERVRAPILGRFGALTTIGFGPRFLHSTGQLHKGGPPGGVFIQLVDSAREVVAIPETDSTFNTLIAAQASGDRAALAERSRTVIAIDLGSQRLDVAAERLVELITG